MAKGTGLLHCLGTVLNTALASGKGFIGHAGFDLLTAQRCLATRWVSTSAPLAEAAAASQVRPVDAAASTAASSDSRQDANSGASSSAREPSRDGGFSVGFRRVLSERRGAMGALEGVVHIQNTLNNIILTLTDKDGGVKTVTSAGVVGFRGSRKSQPVAAEKAAEELARRALKMGYSSVAVRLKGAGSNKQYAVQSLASAGLQITSLADVTPIPYNGCRPPKKRRV